MTFAEFLHAYQTNTLDKDAAWRAYDIMGSVRPVHTQRALKLLGFKYAGELAVPEAMARYGLKDRSEAEATLGAWGLWKLIGVPGRRPPVKRRAVGEGIGWLHR